MRTRVLAALTFVLMVLSIPLSGFTFIDDDSILYSTIAHQLAEAPFSTWMQPQWPPGRWKSGAFEEHMAVFFWPPALLGKLGVETQLAILIVNNIYLLVILLCVCAFVRRHAGDAAAMLAAWTWVLSPAAVTYLVRGNHEPALGAGVVVAIYCVSRRREHWGFGLGAALACAWCLAMKGVLGLVILPVLLAWWYFDGAESRGALVLAGCTFAMIACGAIYDVMYAHVQGYSFFGKYLDIHLGYAVDKDRGVALSKWRNVEFYVRNALLGFFPWSAGLIVAWVAKLRAKESLDSVVKGALSSVAIYIAFLSYFDRLSIRYIFSVYPIMALCAAPMIYAYSARVRNWMEKPAIASPTTLMAGLLVVLWGRILVHTHFYHYVSTQR